MEKEPKPATRRRWLSVSIRMLMVAVLVLAVLLASTINRARAQRRAVDAIRKAEAWYYCDSTDLPRDHDHSKMSKLRKWIYENLGEEYSCDIAEVHIFEHAPSQDLLDKVMPYALPRLKALEINNMGPQTPPVIRLGAFAGLDTLDVINVPLSDDSIAKLGSFKKLRHASLWQTGLSDSSLYHLRNLSELRFLSILNQKLSGPGLKHLARLPHLTTLEIEIHENPDQVLAGIESLTNLEELRLHFRVDRVTISRFDRLTKLPRLRSLEIHGSWNAPDGQQLASIKGLPPLISNLAALEELDLDGELIGEEWLGTISSLKRLEYLDAFTDRIPKEAVASLKKQLPALTIDHAMR